MPSSLRVLLIVSLAVNLFLIGAAVTILGGRLVHREGETWMRGFAAGGFPPPPALIKALPPESQKRLDGILGHERREGRELFRTAREARVKAFEAFIADSFSAEELNAALAASHDADLKALGKLHDVTDKIITTLTPEERKQLAGALEACYSATEDQPAAGICKELRHGPRHKMRAGDAPEPPPPPPEDAPPPQP